MGTTIRSYGMTEADMRGTRFVDADKDLLNNGDLFSLTQPQMIGDIHRRFLEAGADIIETNTFSATSIGQSEFFVEDPRERGGRKDPAFYQGVIENKFLNDLAWEINEQSARQCREWADRVANADGKQRFVAGAIGPLTVSLSNSPDADDAGFRVVTFDQVKAAYLLQVRALIAGGADFLLVETIFDSLNAKAALVAIQEVFERGQSEAADLDLRGGGARRRDDDLGANRRGALECGRAREAALHGAELLARPGPDAALFGRAGDESRRGHLLLSKRRPAESARATGFDLEPADMGRYLGEFAEAGLLNIAGGCCGNTPEHIAAIAKALAENILVNCLRETRSRRATRIARARLPMRHRRGRVGDRGAACSRLCRTRRFDKSAR